MVEPCSRPECKAVIQSIFDFQFKNQVERDDLLRQCEELVLETETLEEEYVKLEERARDVAHDGNTLEEHLELVASKLAKQVIIIVCI